MARVPHGAVTRAGRRRVETMQHNRDLQERQVVQVIRKGPKQEIRVSLSSFRGRTIGDLRLSVPSQQGEWVPTMKGCTVGLEQLDELLEAVGKLRHAAEHAPGPA
jgi:transcriptional coactivator p15 (PC4)